VHAAVPVNVFDDLNQQGADAWLNSMRQTPPSQDTNADVGLTFEQVVARHIGLLDAYPPLHDFYLAQPGAVAQYGLPATSQRKRVCGLWRHWRLKWPVSQLHNQFAHHRRAVKE